jgi:16S rRNA (guanine527-N7)-methyltransferase
MEGGWGNQENDIIAIMDKLKTGARELGIDLTANQVEQFEIYYRELVEWNKKINLTGITAYEDVQVKHFLDSLTVIKAIESVKVPKGMSVIDIGTGAGLPGIPLKIVFPDIRLVLLEATAKKVKFLESLVKKLGLEGVGIITGRAEDAAQDERYREKFALVVSRAVASLPALVELTLPFCTVGGSFVAQKKGDIESETALASKAVSLMGGRLRETVPVELEGLDDGRILVVIDKVEPTPDKYPRRSGIPAKRPIIID